MFGLGFGEMLLILIVALVVIGPKKLPDAAKLIGRGMSEFRRHTDDFQRTFHREIHTPLRNAELLKTAAKFAQVHEGPPPAETKAEPVPPSPPTQPVQETSANEPAGQAPPDPRDKPA